MTETPITPAAPAPVPNLGRQSPGEYLRKLREEKGHSHAVVGTALHLTVHYIKALESDDYGKLPGLTFVKGYLRAYARFLGADVDSVIARFDEHIAGLLDAGLHTARVERSKRRQDQALRWAIGAGCVVVASLVAGWWFVSGRDTPDETVARITPVQTTIAAIPPSATTTAVPPRATPTFTAAATTLAATSTYTPASLQNTLAGPGPVTQAGTAAATVTPGVNGARQVALIGAGSDELTVTFTGSSWIEVDDGSRVRLYQEMLSAGDTLTIRGNAPFHVLLGDASKVAVAFNAAPVDITADIRADSTARLVLGAPAGANVPQSAQESAQEVPQ